MRIWEIRNRPGIVVVIESFGGWIIGGVQPSAELSECVVVTLAHDGDASVE